jgi:3D (Asp-Asp-Asp) domain-containing protein
MNRPPKPTFLQALLLALVCAGVIYAADMAVAVAGIIRDADEAARAAPVTEPAPPTTTPHIRTPDASPVGGGVHTAPPSNPARSQDNGRVRTPAPTSAITQYTLTAEDTQTAIDLYNARVLDDNAARGDTPPEGAEYLGELQVYGYNYLDGAQVGKANPNGITASGELAVSGETCAYNAVPFGTRLYIEGFGVVTVNDRAPKGSAFVDVAFDNDAECYAITDVRGVYRLNDD